jgi:hypothetical protein
MNVSQSTCGKWLGLGFCSLIALALALSFPGRPLAQEYFGGIVGTVTDSSGAAIPKAAITVTNTQTGAVYHTTSNQYGYYTVSNLIPGVYSVKGEMNGFQSKVVTPVKIVVAQTVTIDMTLAVGVSTQSVQVTATAPLLNTTNGTIGTVVNNKTVIEMPLNGRNFTDLLELVPGAVSTGSAFMANGGSNYAISGTQSMSNQFTLDGVYNDEEFFGQFGLQPNIDSIQEFKAQSNITSAQFGRASGANIAVATKSGTNQFHGDVYEFLRNDAFDANPWFNNYFGSPRGAYRQNQYGFTAGGPIYIPHFYNGKDKAWVFGEYEGLKFNVSQANSATVPTEAMLGGDFSSFLTGAQAVGANNQPLFDDLGRPIMVGEIYNPATTRAVTAGQVDPVTGLVATGTGFVRDQFPGNIIPTADMSPAAVAYAHIWYPLVTTPGFNNFINTNPFTLTQYQYSTRADYNFSQNLRSFFRFSDQHAYQLSPTGLATNVGYLYNTFVNAEASLTWLVSPTFVFDFKSAFNRSNLFDYNNNPAPGVGNYLSQFPLQGTPIKSSDAPMFPSMNISGYSSPSQTGNPFITNTWQQLADFTEVHGKHTVHFGASWEHLNTYYDGIFTSIFNFDQIPTGDPQNLGAAGNPVASFLLGLPSSGLRNVGDTAAYMHQNTYGTYIQDDVRETSKLTLNIGLRWEYDQWPFESNNELGTYYLDTHSFGWSGINPITQQVPNTTRSLMNPQWRNLMPRLGMAYSVTPKTVVRAGFGIYYNADYAWQGQGARGQWPYAVSETISSTNIQLPTAPLLTYFGNYDVPLPGTPPNEQHIVARDNLTPSTRQYNLDIQHQLTQSLMAEVDYLHTDGRNLPDFINVNDPPPGNPNPVGSALNPRPEAKFAPTLGAMSENANQAMSHYDAFVVKVNKTFSRGLEFGANYTWSHLLDTPGGSNYGGGSPQNPNCRLCDYGNDGNNFPSIFTASWVYDLPAGRGRQFLANSNRVVDAVLGGWELSGIFHYNSGFYYTVGLPFDAANVGARANADRPNYVGGQAFNPNPSGSDATKGFLNPAAFAVPNLAFGNVGRNDMIGPNFYNLDMGLYKNFAFGESKSLQFRSEYFNLPNTHAFGCINSTLGTPGFGQASCVQEPNNAARIIQFALKFYW